MRSLRRSRIIAAALAAITLLPAGPIDLADAQEAPAYEHFVGALHNHSGYSDGWPGTTPATYFAKGKAEGLDFFGSGEHSDNADIPVTASEGCLGELLPECIGTDQNALRRWDHTLELANEASDASYTAFRGFEWTSDRFGHINVYLSRNDTNAKADGGYATMESFWKWFTTSPTLGGGSDGLGTFNHPGAKRIDDADPALNWNDFAHVPAADERMVGIEVYNDDDDFGTTHPGNRPTQGYYVHALDKGWHVGAIGAEDLHGDPGDRDDYGAPRWGKTVILAEDRSRESLREALLARRFYAIKPSDGLRLDFSVDGAMMGSRLTRAPSDAFQIVASTNRPDATVEIVTSGGTVVGSGAGSATVNVSNWNPAQRYYFMRVSQADKYIGYGSPVWVASESEREWLAGDLHVHTCYSHDAYCPPDDDNTGPDEFYTLSGDVTERFAEAAARGLDYLAITDHNDVRSVRDPGFGSSGVIGVPGYENSLNGHAQMLGATKIYDRGDSGPAAVRAMADELRAAGGVFQANHPAEKLLTPLENCDPRNLDWKYGFDVPVDTIEVWNISHAYQPPAPSASSNEDAIKYWECWLNRGARVGATGGSDSHWLSLSAFQGPGNPTTWVLAHDRTARGVLDALRAGRTSVSVVPPHAGALQLHLEADADGNGTYEAVVGDEVPPSTVMRVRADGVPNAGLVEVRANGETIVADEPLLPGGEITFRSPSQSGWVRATLRGPDLRDERASTCPTDVQAQTTYCRNHIAVLALTSPIYVDAPPAPTALTYTGPTRATGDSVQVAARLTSGDQPVAGKSISFTNRGRTTTTVTGTDGVASTTMAFPDHGKSQLVEARFAGDDDYEPSQVSATITWGSSPATNR